MGSKKMVPPDLGFLNNTKKAQPRSYQLMPAPSNAYILIRAMKF